MQESPIRKLVPFAEKAKKEGKKVYHLNIGQPDIESPKVALDAIHNFSEKVVEYSHSAGSESYRKGLAHYYQNLGIDVSHDDLMITTEIEGQKIKLKTKIFDEKIDPNFILEKEITVKDGNSLWRIARKTLGGGIYYSEIYKNNIKEIENPDLIFPGQVFNIPNLKNN